MSMDGTANGGCVGIRTTGVSTMPRAAHWYNPSKDDAIAVGYNRIVAREIVSGGSLCRWIDVYHPDRKRRLPLFLNV
jgi:hypothetical protein